LLAWYAIPKALPEGLLAPLGRLLLEIKLRRRRGASQETTRVVLFFLPSQKF